MIVSRITDGERVLYYTIFLLSLCTKYRVSVEIGKKSMPIFELNIFILRSPEPRKGFKITFCIYYMLLLSLGGSNKF